MVGPEPVQRGVERRGNGVRRAVEHALPTPHVEHALARQREFGAPVHDLCHQPLVRPAAV